MCLHLVGNLVCYIQCNVPKSLSFFIDYQKKKFYHFLLKLEHSHQLSKKSISIKE